MMKASMFIGLSVVATALCAVPVGSANAVEYHQNASGTCNGALPVFDQKLRFRPLAITNEATTNAFLSCTALNLLSNPVEIFGARIHNPTAAPVDVSCTFVSGRDSFAKTSFPKTQAFAAGAGGFIVWDYNTDNGGVKFADLSNVSCNLPAGVELEYIANLIENPL